MPVEWSKFTLFLTAMAEMLKVYEEEHRCELKGTRRDWQILWSDSGENLSLIGMTPKMKEQMEWCGQYLYQYRPRAPFQSPLFKLEVCKRIEPDQLLLYTMILRRLKNESHPEYAYYTLLIPKFLPSDTEGELVMLLSGIGGKQKKPTTKIRMDVYLDMSVVGRPSVILSQ